MVNFAQTLSLLLRSNYDRSQSSYLLIIIVDFHNQKASILPGNNQRKYITTRTNREQNLFLFHKICTAWKVSQYGYFLIRIFLYLDQKKLRIWTLFTQWWTETESLYFMNILSVSSSLCHSVTLRKKCPNTEFFQLGIFLYSVQI